MGVLFQIDEIGSEDMNYQQTICIGHYNRYDLAKKATEIAASVSKNKDENIVVDHDDHPSTINLHENNNSGDKIRRKSIPPWLTPSYDCKKCLRKICHNPCAFIYKWFGEDWLFLALLGVVMASLSFVIDICSEELFNLHIWLFDLTGQVDVTLQFLVWVCFTVGSVILAAAICHLVAPHSTGSGIPEMKTVMRGVVLKEYLTAKTLVAKSIGLTLCLGSGIPIGKEGPFVHISSIVANLMSKLLISFRGVYENESQRAEMLAAACAVGVACTFGAPIGGVLFSIEVTSAYFAVRNYWRGFFAASASATLFQLLTVGIGKEETVVAFCTTEFRTLYAFDLKEIIFYALLGAMCGFGGSFYVYVHRRVVLFLRENSGAKKVLSFNRFIYPFVISLIIGVLIFPSWTGQFLGSRNTTQFIVNDLFSNFSWSNKYFNEDEMEMVQRWTPFNCSFYLTLAAYGLFQFIFGILTNTMPIPAGTFIPVFLVGASFGRMYGEFIARIFPYGLRMVPGSKEMFPIVAGSYSVVGAAAFSGSVTHTISTSVIVFELTGQIVYILPVMLAVLIANAVSAYLHPSIYDSVIQMKKLPYLPDMLPTNSSIHRIMVQDFMVKQVKYITTLTTYRELGEFLSDTTGIKAFPLVDNPRNVILLGSIPRSELEVVFDNHVGEAARIQEMKRRHSKVSSQSELQNHVTFDKPPSSLLARRRSLSDSCFDVKSMPDIEPKKRENECMSNKENNKSQPNLNNTLIKSKKFSSLAKLHKLVKNHWKKYIHHHTQGISLTDAMKEWLDNRLDMKINFENIRIDPAPFQLVEQTSLYKVHSLFSLLGLNRAYVTRLGQLVGVVAMAEVRDAIQKTTAFGSANSSSKMNRSTSNLQNESNHQKYSEGILPVSLSFAVLPPSILIHKPEDDQSSSSSGSNHIQHDHSSSSESDCHNENDCSNCDKDESKNEPGYDNYLTVSSL